MRQRERLAAIADAADELGYEISTVAETSIDLVPHFDAWPQLPVSIVTIDGNITAETLRRVLRPPSEAEQP